MSYCPDAIAVRLTPVGSICTNGIASCSGCHSSEPRLKWFLPSAVIHDQSWPDSGSRGEGSDSRIGLRYSSHEHPKERPGFSASDRRRSRRRVIGPAMETAHQGNRTRSDDRRPDDYQPVSSVAIRSGTRTWLLFTADGAPGEILKAISLARYPRTRLTGPRRPYGGPQGDGHQPQPRCLPRVTIDPGTFISMTFVPCYLLSSARSPLRYAVIAAGWSSRRQFWW